MARLSMLAAAAVLAVLLLAVMASAEVAPPLARLFGGGNGNGNGDGDGNGNGNGHGGNGGNGGGNGNGNNGNGNGNGGNAVDRENARLAAEYLQLQANNSRAMAAVRRLYDTAKIGNCHEYVNALATSDGHLTELLSPIVTPTAMGRIHPVGFFNGSHNLIEYFMLACAGNQAVLDVTFKKIQANNDIVFYDVDLHMGLTPKPNTTGTVIGNLTHVGWARVNPSGQVCAMKANFQRLEINDRVLPALNGYPAAMAAHNATIYQTCTTIMQRCTGTYAAYPDFGSCVAYLSSINGGGYTRADQPALQCVQLHLILTSFRPDVHCAHVAAGGGGKCSPHPPATWYATDELLTC